MPARKDTSKVCPCGKTVQARGYKLHVRQCKQCAQLATAGGQAPPESAPVASASAPSARTGEPAERPAGDSSFRGFGLGFRNRA